jgi:hypothetical protein
MDLSDRQLNQIGGYVKQNLGDWIQEVVPVRTLPTDPVMLERIVRVEDELKHQRELMQEGFKQMEQRFIQVDQRFEDLRSDMNARFEQVDKRFDDMRNDTNARFEEQRNDTNARFEEQRSDMNARFEQLGRRQALWGVVVSVLITLVVAASTAVTLVLGP